MNALGRLIVAVKCQYYQNRIICHDVMKESTHQRMNRHILLILHSGTLVFRAMFLKIRKRNHFYIVEIAYQSHDTLQPFIKEPIIPK